MRSRGVAALGCILAIGAAACGGPRPSPAATIVQAPPLATATASPFAPAPSAAPPTGTVGPSTPTVLRDDSLIAILPPAVNDIPVAVEEASFDDAMRDPAFAGNVEAAAFAIVVGPDDLASGVVAKLRPGVFGDGFFRDWRETYNEGACAQAGGVVGNAEAELGGRTVFIASCGGGLRVYHARIDARDVIVSLFSLGDGRFGERLMAALRP